MKEGSGFSRFDGVLLGSGDLLRIEHELMGMGLWKLDFTVRQVISLMSPGEQMRYRLSDYCSSYSDISGRVRFLMRLLRDGVIGLEEIELYSGCRISGGKREERKYVWRGEVARGEGREGEDRALTDDIEVVSGDIEVYDAGLKAVGEDGEDGVYVGDKVRFEVSVRNYPEGAPVRFEVYDVTESTPFLIKTLTGKNEGGKAVVEWDVEDPQGRGEGLKIGFEASARSKYSDRVNTPVKSKIECEFVEIPDVHFHHGSAVPLLDEGGGLIGSLVTALEYGKRNDEKEVVLFGHTDTTGDPSYNYDMSCWRAEGVKALLDGDEEKWVDVVKKASKVEDYQMILKTLSVKYGWGCDPGKVDDKNGPETQAGVKGFQQEYNSRYNGSLKVDGVMGSKSWGAVFRVIREILREEYKRQSGEEELPKVNYGYNGKGIYGCGESFPIEDADKDNYKSATNRRVEIVFFDKGKTPQLKEPAEKGKVEKKEAPVYDKRKCEKKKIESVAATTEAADDRWIVFEETAEKIDPDFPYEMSKAQPPENRWWYVFGSEDGSSFTRVWEIRSDSSGKKYATFELTEGNYDSRPSDEPWEDVAFLPGKTGSGKPMKLLACVSDVRLTKERIFGKTNGLLADPRKRCSDIDDPKQATRKVIGDTEKVVILNPLLHAELLRKRFDEFYSQWEEIRRASWLEQDEKKKKEKLVYEFGSLIIRIIEAYPEYRKHLAAGQYPRLHETIKAYEQRKIKLTTEATNRVDALCRFIGSELFAETCRDYTSLIRKGNVQSKEYMDFENRIGALVENITRFQQGADTIKKLIPEVKSASEHSWLQDMLLLKNDVWRVTGTAPIDDRKEGMSDEEKFQNLRELGEGAVELLLEAAKAGTGVYKPQELMGILNKVFATTGESVKAGLEKVPMSSSGARPFQKVLGSFDEKSFWRIQLEGKYENMFTKGPVKESIEKFLLGLEGIALLYSLKEHLEKSSAGEAGTLDRLNISIRLLTWFAKAGMIKVPYKGALVKIGEGPIMLAGAVSALFDFATTTMTVKTKLDANDLDSALFNSIAAAGLLASTIGYGALTTTFFAGAAATASTGIGLAPGLLLAFIGSAIAIGGNILAAQADNTPLENMLLSTPWGTHPEQPESSISTSVLQKQYLKAMRLINSFRVSIDHDTMTATLHLPRLEPVTVITIHEVIFGIATKADGSSSTSQVVGNNIKLNDGNCEVVRNKVTGTTDVRINLLKVCPSAVPFLQQWKSYYNSFGKEPKPDYIKLTITVDLDGDGVLVLPEEKKRLAAECYYGQKVKTAVV